MARKRTKRDHRQWERFVALCTESLESVGARHSPDGWYPWQLWTRAGRLWIDFQEHAVTPGPGTAFCRFDDPERAVELGIDCNPHSGKWNHFFGSYWDAESAAAAFCSQLNSICRTADTAAA